MPVYYNMLKKKHLGKIIKHFEFVLLILEYWITRNNFTFLRKG